ncbi:MAG: DUF4433 domain-containing protein [Bacteroidota bacterium]
MATPVYHITHIDNLSGIIAEGGLWSKARHRQHDVCYNDIAHGSLQIRRGTTKVTAGPGGVLHEYVPFYFAPRSPMLYAIHRGAVSTYQGNQHDIIYLGSLVETIAEEGLAFVFTDIHAVLPIARFFDDVSGFESIDWKLMQEMYWFDSLENPNRKARRQAEFLVHDFCPLHALEGIAVYDRKRLDHVNQLLGLSEVNIPTGLRPQFYY